jgi:glycosyltransferase involved in cell wall biosynthesis
LLRQPHGGASSARNHGIGASRGEFVALLDSDDTWPEGKVERQLSLMAAEGYTFSHTSYWRVESDGSEKLISSGKFSGRVYPAIIGGCPIASSSVMVRRDVFENIGMFPDSISIGEDVVQWIRVAAVYDLLGINEPLVNIHVGATATIRIPEKMAIGVVNILRFVMDDERHRLHHFDLAILVIGGLNAQLDQVLQCDAEAMERALANGTFLSIVKSVRPDDVYIELRKRMPMLARIFHRPIWSIAAATNRRLARWPRIQRIVRAMGQPLLSGVRARLQPLQPDRKGG